MRKGIRGVAKSTWSILFSEEGFFWLVLFGVLFVEMPACLIYNGDATWRDVPAMWLNAAEALGLWIAIESAIALCILGVILLVNRQRRRPQT